MSYSWAICLMVLARNTPGSPALLLQSAGLTVLCDGLWCRSTWRFSLMFSTLFCFFSLSFILSSVSRFSCVIIDHWKENLYFNACLIVSTSDVIVFLCSGVHRVNLVTLLAVLRWSKSHLWKLQFRGVWGSNILTAFQPPYLATLSWLQLPFLKMICIVVLWKKKVKGNRYLNILVPLFVQLRNNRGLFVENAYNIVSVIDV